MRSDVRACAAYVALRLISGRSASAVYDYSGSGYISIDGQITATNVDVYDYSRGAHFGGNGSGGRFSLYDYGYSHHVDLQINGNNYEGYDYGSSCHFSGTVNGTSTSLYDYGSSGHFDYSL